MPEIDQKTIEAIIVGNDAEQLVSAAEKIGNKLKDDKLSTSQIRGIFGTVRRLEMDWIDPLILNSESRSDLEKEQLKKRSQQAQREFTLLQPRIAYQVERLRKKEGGKGVERLADELLPAMKLVIEGKRHDDKEYYQRFRNFVDFFEAILAYHRAAGGSN